MPIIFQLKVEDVRKLVVLTQGLVIGPTPHDVPCTGTALKDRNEQRRSFRSRTSYLIPNSTYISIDPFRHTVPVPCSIAYYVHVCYLKYHFPIQLKIISVIL